MLSLFLALTLNVLPSTSANAATSANATRTGDAPAQAPTTATGSATSTSQVRAGEFVARVSTTGMAVKLALPTLETDPTAFKPMKRRYADRAVAQGRIRGGEGTVQIVAAYGEMRTSRTWRETLMAGKLVGAGQFDVGHVACTEQTRDLEPPYSDLGWHGFLTAGDTCFDFSLFTLAKAGDSPVKRAEFESIVREARYAVVRLGAWEEMPTAVLDRMHEGFTRPENDGVAYLTEQAKTATDGWACALAAAEIGISTHAPAAERLALCERVLADLAKVEAPGKAESFAKLTALTGRALAQRDADQLDAALETLKQAAASAKEHSPVAQSAVDYDTATVLARKKDVDGTVAALKASIAVNEDRRMYATYDASFQPLAKEKALLTLLRSAPK